MNVFDSFFDSLNMLYMEHGENDSFIIASRSKA